jgi:hypothetical protein
VTDLIPSRVQFFLSSLIFFFITAQFSSAENDASIHIEGLTGNFFRFFRSQKHHGIADAFGGLGVCPSRSLPEPWS